MPVGLDPGETRAQTFQKSPEFLSTPESPTLLQDVQPSDSIFLFLNVTRAGLGSDEHFVFAQDELEDSENDALPGGSTQSGISWFLWAQELALNSLTAVISPQVAKNESPAAMEEMSTLQGSSDGSRPQVEGSSSAWLQAVTSHLSKEHLKM